MPNVYFRKNKGEQPVGTDLKNGMVNFDSKLAHKYPCHLSIFLSSNKQVHRDCPFPS